MGSIMEASPCVRVEKRKHAIFQGVQGDCDYESPNKARIVEKPSIAFQSGSERMIQDQRGLLERRNLEDSCFVGAGEDTSISCKCYFTHSFPL